MKFDNRTYTDIVRDMLTALTGGTTQEVHVIPQSGIDRLDLYSQPVRRVSHLQGQITVGDELVDYRFTERDFELVGTDQNPDDFVAIRFRSKDKKPAPGSTVTVNYYPTRLRPTPINDVNVGSVARTLIETVSREIAVQYQQLQKVYDSAFVETAVGVGLDKVVALVDVKRLKKGHAVGKVRFSRRSGSAGSVYIPINTVVTDGDKARYVTSEAANLLTNQSSIEVWVHGETRQTAAVDTGKLTVLERVIAGIDRVTNDEPTYAATEDEKDEQLSSRGRKAIHGTGKGTLDAIRFGLLSLPFVSAVTLSEYNEGEDNIVPLPGMLRIDVAMSEDNAYKRSLVDQTIASLRPAGIYIERNWAGKVDLGFAVNLRLAGSTQQSSVITEIKDGISARLKEYALGLAPNAILRRSRCLSLILQDQRVVDAELMITVDSQSVTTDQYTLPADKTGKVDTASPVMFGPVSFDEQSETAQFSLVNVDADFVVGALSLTVDEVETLLTQKLRALIEPLKPGAQLTFAQVQTALRDQADPSDSSRYALIPAQSVIALEAEGGTFTELRSNDSYTVPTNTGMVVRNVEVKTQGDNA